MKVQDWNGDEVSINNLGDNEACLFSLFGSLQEIGDLLNIEGKFRVNYGTDRIKERIIKLKDMCRAAKVAQSFAESERYVPKENH